MIKKYIRLNHAIIKKRPNVSHLGLDTTSGSDRIVLQLYADFAMTHEIFSCGVQIAHDTVYICPHTHPPARPRSGHDRSGVAVGGFAVGGFCGNATGSRRAAGL